MGRRYEKNSGLTWNDRPEKASEKRSLPTHQLFDRFLGKPQLLKVPTLGFQKASENSVGPCGCGSVDKLLQTGKAPFQLQGHRLVAAQIVFLMIVLSPGEPGEILSFGLHLPLRVLPPRHSFSPSRTLVVIVKKNGRHVLPSIGLSEGVVPLEKTIQYLGVGNLLRVELDLSALGVVADSVIGGVLSGAGGITDPGDKDSWKTPKLGVGSPESSQGEGGGF